MSTSVVTLITGLQGNGKTLMGIDMVKRVSEGDNAQVYYHGINELVLPWLPLEKPEDWPDVPDGSIVFLDEAQKLFRVRANGAQVPRWVSELETLRHRGIRLYLLTQHPMLLDTNVRRLCGHHIHLVRKFGAQASSKHEWNAVRENCDKPAGRKDSQRSTYKFNKAIYTLYKSAEVHTVKRKIPPKVLAIVPLSIAALALLGYVGYRKVYKPMHGESEEAAMMKAGGRSGASGQIAYGTEGDRRSRPLTTAEYMASYTPRIPGLDYTAPAYDELTKPKRVPVPAACVTFKGGCSCYTQQGTRLPVQKDQCAQIVQTGFFMAFDPDGEQAPKENSQAKAPPAPEPVREERPPVIVVQQPVYAQAQPVMHLKGGAVRPPSALDLGVFDEPPRR